MPQFSPLRLPWKNGFALQKNELRLARRYLLNRCLATAVETHPHGVKENVTTVQRGEECLEDSGNQGETRTNVIGIPMLPKSLWKQVFTSPPVQPTSVQRTVCEDGLRRFGLLGKTQSSDPVTLPLPPLSGSNIQDHFRIIAQEQIEEYEKLINVLVSNDCPPMPTTWSRELGWTRYDPSTGEAVSVDYPGEDALVFDIETIAVESNGHYPVIATAASDKYWYSWVSPSLFTEEPIRDMIPLGRPDHRRVVVGHHVAFDRARVGEEYRLEPSKTAWMDTMSLHSAIGGLSTQQRPSWMKYKKLREEADTNAEAIHDLEQHERLWHLMSSNNSLKSVAQLHLEDFTVDKEIRTDLFFKGTRQKVREQFQEAMAYCAKDVEVTFRLFQRLYVPFRKKCPHPVSLAGIIHMGKGYLPISNGWDEYVNGAEAKHLEYQEKIDNMLIGFANEALKMAEGEKWKDDPWLNKLDWTVKPRSRTLNGKPEWYRELWDSKSCRIRITLSKRAVPYLLRLKWMNYPVYYSRPFGWTFVVPKDQGKALVDFKRLSFDKNPDDKHYDEVASFDENNLYFRVPHKNGNNSNCGNPLSKYYISMFEDGKLSANMDNAVEVLKLQSSCSYWQSARARIQSQFVVRDPKLFGCDMRDANGNPASVILPQSIVMGTITRRAVEPTWMTAANAKASRVGSELKAQVHAPQGYRFVGADVDSEELWLASLIGDAQLAIQGGTPIGFMTLQGTKAQGTDLHSVTGRIVGISRDQSKVFNYARIYGAGQKFAEQLIIQCVPGATETQAREKASKLFKETKGERFPVKMLRDAPESFKSNPKAKFWCGGTESFMFNRLEEIATSRTPKTPTLKCEIPDSLNPALVDHDFLRSRINWVVQSSGVDYLHLLLVSMDYLMRRMRIRARFVLSIHDELRFMVKEEDTMKAVLAMQISNLWVRAMFAASVGMNDLPMAVAFFAAVDVDRFLRKEVDLPCITPSNPVALPKEHSYDIKHVEKEFSGSSVESLYGSELDSVVQLKEKRSLTSPSLPDEQPVIISYWLHAQNAKSREEIWALSNDFDMAVKENVPFGMVAHRGNRKPSAQAQVCEKVAEAMRRKTQLPKPTSASKRESNAENVSEPTRRRSSSFGMATTEESSKDSTVARNRKEKEISAAPTLDAALEPIQTSRRKRSRTTISSKEQTKGDQINAPKTVHKPFESLGNFQYLRPSTESLLSRDSKESSSDNNLWIIEDSRPGLGADLGKDGQSQEVTDDTSDQKWAHIDLQSKVVIDGNWMNEWDVAQRRSSPVREGKKNARSGRLLVG
ncbi:DNA polymerase gamma [Cladochytrium replicatum]|nr:DNA polymerase gamma [Cladochytrium replicatum]